jgi:hypothetical protein
MKTKKLFLSTITGVLFSANLLAADLCVNESGGGGCYSSIAAALAAANDGDRIFIQPKAGGAPYVESLTINKSVQLLSNTEGAKWALIGNITITPAVAGTKISILHMKNNAGNIETSSSSPIGARCEVNIIDCELLAGYINFDYDYFNVNVVACKITGYVVLRYGNVIGNEITANSYTTDLVNLSGLRSSIYYGSDAAQTNDTLHVVGNKITYTSTDVCNKVVTGITMNTTSQFFNVSNNYITSPNATSACSYGLYGIFLYDAQNSALTKNTIYNNTFYTSASGYVYGIYVYSHPASANTEIFNNLILNPNATSECLYVYSNNGNLAFSFNYAKTSIYNLTNDGTNNLNTNTTINLTNGQLNTGSDGINGGYPDPTFYDLDLTVNDVGAYGGSFSLSNFYPVTGAARVYFVNAPRTVLQSGTLNIRANSFDR